ncbi:MAG: FtsQ-type POTRA domain-containing protein [Chlorobium sp.]
MSDSEQREYSDDLTEPESGESPITPVPGSGGSKLLLLIMLLSVLAALAVLASSASHWKKEVIVRGFVVDGESIIPEQELMSRLSDYKGLNFQEIDSDELRQRVMVHPYLQSAVVTKELNGVLRIKVSEREPVALAVLGNSTMVLDREGFLLPWRQEVADRYPDLFSIAGISHVKIVKNGLQQLDKRDVGLILKFLEALSGADYARLLIKELHLAGNNLSWCIAGNSPTRFIIGNDGNFKEKLKKFEIFWQKVVSKKGFGFYDTVDLRFTGRVFTTVPVSPEVSPDHSR